MSTEIADTQTTETKTPESIDLNSPELSFSDFQKIRRGETVQAHEKSSAPEAKPTEHKSVSESEPDKTEAINEDQTGEDVGSEEDTTDLENDKPRKHKGIQKRINKLNARFSAAQAEIEQLKQLAFKKADETRQATKVESGVGSDHEPDAGDFETHSAYVKAVAKWTLEQDKKATKEEESKKQILSDYEKLNKAYFDRLQSFSKKTPDLKEALSEIDDIVFPPYALQAIKESELGPEISYELAKNREEAERISKLSPLSAARELGKIEEKISLKTSQEQKTETKKTTSAPQPIVPVGGSSKGSVRLSITDPEISFSDYEKARREQLKRRRA